MLSTEVHAYGEAALYVKVDGEDREQVWQATHALGERIARLEPVLNVVPTYDTVFVEFDVTAADADSLRTTIEDVLSAASEARADTGGRRFTVPVAYGGEHGPDLARLANVMGMSEGALVRAHTLRPLPIRCLAGPLGGPMMSGPDLPCDVPRQTSPRPKVGAGSVLLAGRQSFIKTMDGPGGWQIIGTTPLRVIDLDDDPLVPWRPGDTIRFRAIAASEWAAHQGMRPVADDD